MGPDPVDFQTHVAVQCSYTANAIGRPDARGFAGGVVAMKKKSVHGLWACRVSGPLEIRLIREQAACGRGRCFVIASSTRLQTGGDCIGQWSSSHRGDTRTRDESVGAPRK
jgi:hypothetical protein